MLIDVEYIARAGEPWPDSYAIASSVQNETSARNETLLVSADDIEEAFFFAEPLARPFPSRPVTRAKWVQRHPVDRQFDEHFQVQP